MSTVLRHTYLNGMETVMGDIGEPVRHIELEPVEAPARREFPAAPVPATEPEKVPA